VLYERSAIHHFEEFQLRGVCVGMDNFDLPSISRVMAQAMSLLADGA